VAARCNWLQQFNACCPRACCRDQISGRGKKEVCLVSTVISRLVGSVVRIDRQWGSKMLALSGLDALLCSRIMDSLVRQGLGKRFNVCI
jgi:hypothetical protein